MLHAEDYRGSVDQPLLWVRDCITFVNKDGRVSALQFCLRFQNEYNKVEIALARSIGTKMQSTIFNHSAKLICSYSAKIYNHQEVNLHNHHL